MNLRVYNALRKLAGDDQGWTDAELAEFGVPQQQWGRYRRFGRKLPRDMAVKTFQSMSQMQGWPGAGINTEVISNPNPKPQPPPADNKQVKTTPPVTRQHNYEVKDRPLSFH